MAFGGLKGTLQGNGNSVTNPSSLTGSVSVAVGDLVVVAFGQQTNLTATAAADNLLNSYSAQNAGTDAGTATGRMFYSRVTNAGTLSQIDVTASASVNDWAAFAAVIEGPFAITLLDTNPANTTGDLTSPFTCPATGTLAQASEVVIAWMASDGNAVWAATSPNLKAGQINNSTNIKSIIGYQAVSATTSVAPEFTGTNPGVDVLGTVSFRQADIPGPGQGSITTTGQAPTLAVTDLHDVSPAQGGAVITGQVPTVTQFMNVAPGQGAVDLTGQIPSLVATEHQIAQPAQGVLTLTGEVPTLAETHSAFVQPAEATLTLTGEAPTTVATAHQFASPTQGIAIITGEQPSIVATDHHATAPADGVLTIGGQTPAISVSSGNDKTVTPDAGVVTLAGEVPALLLSDNWVVSPGAGSLALEGQTPGTPIEIFIAPGTGALSIESDTPILGTSHTIICGTGELAFSGQAPVPHIVPPQLFGRPIFVLTRISETAVSPGIPNVNTF